MVATPAIDFDDLVIEFYSHLTEAARSFQRLARDAVPIDQLAAQLQAVMEALEETNDILDLLPDDYITSFEAGKAVHDANAVLNEIVTELHRVRRASDIPAGT